ncbi:MAG: hypothetical protein FWD55_05685 [Propionibacteriaceae bacterium]|nr:hypothetical protein [Propionibacteriaceae bacterium]
MSAIEVTYLTETHRRPALHVVYDGETSANFRRKAYARSVSRAHTIAAVRTYGGLSCVLAVFLTAVTTMAWAFLSVPNTPLP